MNFIMSNHEEKILPAIELELSSPIKKSIIWLHGLGADGSDFVPVAYELKLPPSTGIRFIFPHAPIMPVALNNGYKMRAWFNIYDLSVNAKIDVPGIQQSISEIKKLIQREVARGIATDNILLAGFSQGATLALLCGLTHTPALGGIIALSGFLPLENGILNTNNFNTHLPIFLAHGTEDSVVPYAYGQATYMALKKVGLTIDWHSYAMGHSVCPEEINDLSLWLKRIGAKNK